MRVKLKERDPVRVEVALREYDQNNRQWKRMPASMIRKVAVKQGHQMAFPSLFQGLNMEDENERGLIIDLDPEPSPTPIRATPIQSPPIVTGDATSPEKAGEPVTIDAKTMAQAKEARREHAIPPNLLNRVQGEGIEWDDFLGIIGVESWTEWREMGRTAADAWTVYQERVNNMVDDEEDGEEEVTDAQPTENGEASQDSIEEEVGTRTLL